MKRSIATVIVFFSAVGLVGTNHAAAQEMAPGTGTTVISIVPGGATFFTEGKDTNGPKFGNYDLGGTVTVNLNRYVGVEGSVGGALGVTQDLNFGGQISNVKSPNLLNYAGNLVISAPNRSSVVPYVTGGIGGLSLFETTDLGINGTETFLTSNIGGGVNWYSGRWGLRGDYRFIAVKSKDDAPDFFGQETRYGHRVSLGVLLRVVR